MENTATAATDPSADVVDVVITSFVAATVPTASTDTTAKAKVKVKKELTTAERGVQNQKRQARRVAQRTRKSEAMHVALEEERRERLMIMAARAQAQEAMNRRQLIGEGKTDAITGVASSNLVTSQA
jgi:hypothetical protein